MPCYSLYLIKLIRASAILRETSAGTSYQMVRLVFRPYTQIRRSICTSEPLRASTRVSSGFTLFRHSSPSFGSQQLCSYSNPSEDIRIGRLCTSCEAPTYVHFHYAYGFYTQTLAQTLDSLVRVSRRAAYNHYASILDLRRSPQSQLAVFPQAIILTEASYIPMDLSCHQN